MKLKLENLHYSVPAEDQDRMDRMEHSLLKHLIGTIRFHAMMHQLWPLLISSAFSSHHVTHGGQELEEEEEEEEEEGKGEWRAVDEAELQSHIGTQ
jgi:hypothetical protein